MSTRGCVAVISSDGGWQGPYNHSDSYPTWLGKEIWELMAGKSKEDLQILARRIVSGCDYRFENILEPGSRTGKGANEENITSQNPDPLCIEWVYILNPDKQELTILAHESKPRRGKAKMYDEPVLRKDGFYDYGDCLYRHKEVARISLTEHEPDWQKIENNSH